MKKNLRNAIRTSLLQNQIYAQALPLAFGAFTHLSSLLG